MRPFFGVLLLFFTLFFSETEASGSFTPRLSKKKKTQTQSVGVINLNAIPPPPKNKLPDMNDPVDEPRRKVANLNKKPQPGNHDSTDLQEAHNILKKPLDKNAVFPEHLQFHDNRPLHYNKDVKEYDDYKQFQAVFGGPATPAYLPNLTTNYDDYYSGGGAHLGDYENLSLKKLIALKNKKQDDLQNQQQQAEQQQTIQHQQQQILHDQQQQAIQHQQQQGLYYQQPQALYYQQQQALYYQQQQALQHQQPHTFDNNMGYFTNFLLQGNHPNDLPYPHFPGGSSGGDPNLQFQGGHSGGHESG